jgi:hypothetical protein
MNERRLGIRDIPQALIGKVSGEIILADTKIEIIDPNNSIPAAKESLSKNSLIQAFSHTEDDYKVWAKFGRELASLKQVGTVVAWQYYDLRRGVKSLFMGSVLRTWEKGFGVTMIPTVQDYDRGHYPNADTLNFQSTRATLKFIGEPGHILALAPTGHRDISELSRAVEGVGAILTRVNPNTLILPTAIIPSSIKPGIATKVYVGKLLLPQDLEEKRAQIFGEVQSEGKTKLEIKHQHNQELADTLMLEIAQLLPEQYRGYYTQLAAEFVMPQMTNS